MPPNFLDRETFGRICVQNLSNQIFARFGNESWNQIVAIEDLFVQFAGIWILEWEVAASHGIENDTCAPYIRIEPMVPLPGDHLRRRVAWTATGCLEHFTFLVHVGQTEVDDLDVVLVVKQQVFGLEVAVADAYLVDVLYAGDDLLREPTGLLFI